MEGLNGIVQMLDPHAVIGHAGGERCIPLRSLPDLRLRNPGDLGDLLDGKLRGPLFEIGETVAPLIHKGLVVKALFDDMIDHGKGEGAVCPGPDLQPQIRVLGGIDPSRVDDNDLRSLLLPGFERRFPEHIPVPWTSASPQKDALRVVANNGKKAPPKNDVAHDAKWPVTDLAGACMIRRSEKVKESLSDLIVGSTGTARRGDRFRAETVDDFFKLLADLRKRIVPRNPLPPVFSPAFDSFKRIIQPAGVIKILDDISPPGATLCDGIGRLRAGKR